MPIQSPSAFFMVRFKRYEGTVQNDTIFADIIRSYLKAHKHSAGKIIRYSNGLHITIRYKIGRRNLFWLKKSGNAVLQETFKMKYGYCIITRSITGEIISKSRYNNKYQWCQTAYYSGNTDMPQAVLKPMAGENGLILLKFETLTGKYSKMELLPFPYYSGTAQQSLINTIAGEPQVLARTNYGTFCYCPNYELESRRAVIKDLDMGRKSLVPKWGSVEAKNVDFKYIENDKPIDKPKAEKQPKPILPTLDKTDYKVNREVFSTEIEKSGKYSVAAKGISGNPKVCDNIPLHNDRRAKRIVISAQESYTYFGDVINGLREGQGRTQMQNGQTAYEGGYINDKRDGFGTYYYKSGKICYVGSWKENKRSGVGVAFSSSDGSIFVGKWKNNIPTGNGAAFDSDGNLVYTGEWKNGMRHGMGTEFKNGKIIFSGEFRFDKYYLGHKYTNQE